MLQGGANFVPALNWYQVHSLWTKCYGARPADVLFWMDSGEIRAIAYSSGIKQHVAITGPAIFCLTFRSKLKRFREGLKRYIVEAFAYVDDVLYILA